MRTCGALPAIGIASPARLLTMITATAPARCALTALSSKVEVPRSTRAMAPAGNPTSAPQPRVGSALPSSTRTIGPATPAAVGAGPKLAPEAGYVPAAAVGGSIVTRLGNPSGGSGWPGAPGV